MEESWRELRDKNVRKKEREGRDLPTLLLSTFNLNY
jgi:hypothetical protein